jgi:hypothetical protein
MEAATRTLAAQRLALCVRLQIQRDVIAHQLGGAAAPRSAFPRSRTLRLLTDHPQAVLKTIGALAFLFRRR